MVCFPNCKINLGLRILDKREDGFHNLETIFYPVLLKDGLEIINSTSNDPVEFTQSGLSIDGIVEENLCVKAWQLIKKDFPQLPAVRLHLHKCIPMGAGLGGGSSDAAFTLQLLNDKFQLGLTKIQLLQYAAQLGSDGPFFIINKPCHATGRGEELTEINVDLRGYFTALINPGIHINTGWAFSKLSDGSKATGSYPKSLTTIIQQPISTWKDELQNDFESPVAEKYPQIITIKEDLYNLGAVYAAMSGSGSTVFGLFETAVSLTQFENQNYITKLINGS